MKFLQWLPAHAAARTARRLADAVSLSRLLLLVPWVCLQSVGSRLAALVMALIVLTDLIDGPIARRLRTAGSRGQLLDAACDAVVVVIGALVLGLGDWRLLTVTGLMLLCFGTWTARGVIARRFVYTRLGRYDGAVCYLLILVGSAAPWLSALGHRVHVVAEWGVIAAVALLLGASVVENAAALLRSGAPATGRGRLQFTWGSWTGRRQPARMPRAVGAQ